VSTHLLIESALRSLLMGAAIFAALRLMRIHQVRARRAAWLLALAGSLAMPALIAARIGPPLLPDIAVFRAPPAARLPRAESADQGATQRVQPIMSAAPAGAASTYGGPSRGARLMSGLLRGALVIYLIVAYIFLLRLIVGIVVALRLRSQSKRTALRFDALSDIRVSPRIAAPITVASSVLLPSTYSSWNSSTLRIVLSHECAHVRQRDFYVQMLAGLHCALFWFSPFSWWLQRQLADLAEALSDHAGVAQAESRASYAEILLAFAAGASSPLAGPLAGVSMARAGNLTPRIERLLNDRGFEQSFAGKRRLTVVAAGVVMLTLAASTSVVRVHAESTETNTTVVRDIDTVIRDTDTDTVIGDTDAETDAEAVVARAGAAGGHKDEFLAIRIGDSRTTFNAGGRLPPISGDYIYFQHQGKPYVIQDGSILARARDLLAPGRELRRKQRELGRQQAELGRRQESLGGQQSAAKKPTPDFKREIAELTKVLEEMKRAQSTPQIDQTALAELEGRLGEVQSNLAVLHAEFATQQITLGEQQAAFGEQQGELGEQQAALGELQRQVIEAAEAQLQPLVEAAIRDGKAKPLQ
jgi:beta-lactamase regulating signal transducer with metallopeptidase domain